MTLSLQSILLVGLATLYHVCHGHPAAFEIPEYNTTLNKRQSSPKKPPTPIDSPQSIQGARGVFAHFMVNNVHSWDTGNWIDEMNYAKSFLIDGFALNMANNEAGDSDQLVNAFNAADSVPGFKLIFSFDYAANSAWDKDVVVTTINTYKGRNGYYYFDNKPLVSTFEGPGSSGDWTYIKGQTGCFFMPDWSSLGAEQAVERGVADGLFSWAAWPTGSANPSTYFSNSMTTYVDASYLQFLNGMPYMMPVSPWFYTNLPGYNKNWMWPSDTLWIDRLDQMLWWSPHLVELISWNDFGESHYIGQSHEEEMDPVFGTGAGKALYNYAEGYDHTGFLALLPWYIQLYKTGTATVGNEVLLTYYRPYPANIGGCSDDKTTGNTHYQFQYEYAPEDLTSDSIFFAVLATGQPSVTVTVGSQNVGITWIREPFDLGVGVYFGRADYSAQGAVFVTANTPAGSSMTVSGGPDISNSCQDGVANWNVWTKSVTGVSSSASNPINVFDMACIQGTAPGNFIGLCETSCEYGYCPKTACFCEKIGEWNQITPTQPAGYPLPGEDGTYSGLCAFDCSIGYCYPTACQYQENTDISSTPLDSPFTPNTCTNGVAKSGFEGYTGLCQYACPYGFCPENICSCTSIGYQQPLPAQTSPYSGRPLDGSNDEGLCNFACTRGYCPPGTCVSAGDTAGCADNDSRPQCQGTYCDYSIVFDNITLLAGAVQNQPNFCTAIAAMRTMMNMLDDLIVEYAKVTDGYAQEFDWYTDYVKASIDDGLQYLMNTSDHAPGESPAWVTTSSGDGNKFFSCQLVEPGTKKPLADAVQCPLPADVYGRSTFGILYTLENRTGFEDLLQSEFGIEPSWYVLDPDQGYESLCQVYGDPHSPSETGGCQPLNQHLYNFPVKAADSVIKPYNPAQNFSALLNSLPTLRQRLGAAVGELITNEYYGAPSDLATNFGNAIFPALNAILNMQEIAKIGKAVGDQERREHMLTIISAVLGAVAFLGDLAPIAGAVFEVSEDMITALTRIAGFLDVSTGLTTYALDIKDWQTTGDPLSFALDMVFFMVNGVIADAKIPEKEAEGAEEIRKAIKEDSWGPVVTYIGPGAYSYYQLTLHTVVDTCLSIN